jgi:hypothetical protein
MRKELFDGFVHRVASGDHEPNSARKRQLLNEIGQRARPNRAFINDSLNRLSAAIVADHAVLTENQALHHIRPHAA